MTSVFVVTFDSESGDKYGPFIFNKKPKDSDLKKLLKKEAPGELEAKDGPGLFGTYLYDWCEKIKIIELK